MVGNLWKSSLSAVLVFLGCCCSMKEREIASLILVSSLLLAELRYLGCLLALLELQSLVRVLLLLL